MENYQNLVGKLLAGENITILQKRMETAAFDIENRTLYLPIWKDMTPEINDMMICHEVSHALFTPMEYVNALDKKLKFKNAKAYLNILEDIRAEKLIKKKYPGIRKSFAQGYKQLNERDFFGAKNKDMKKAHLMDRINLFYKVGLDADVIFSEPEKVFVDRAMKTETIQDVIELAEDIFKYLKSVKEDDKGQENSNPIPRSKKVAGEESEDVDSSNSSDEESEESGEDQESEDSSNSSDEESEESGEDQESEEQKSGEDQEEIGDNSNGAHRNDGTDESVIDDFEDGDITTDEAFSKNAKDLVNMTEDRVYMDISKEDKKKIVSYKNLRELYDETKIPESVLSAIKKFKSDANSTVSYLAKEFEMKKAASSYKRTSIAKSGIIDTKKLYAYQIKDDLFKRMSITKDGKNHGMVILLDWSGSMRYVIQDVLKQAITLVMFCKRVNIPFQVFAFTDSNVPKQWRDLVDTGYDYESKRVDGEIKSNNHWFLMEFFSDKMSNSDMNKMINFLLSYGVSSTVQLNGTPLTESLLYMYNYLDTFKKSNNVEKLSFITLTDGQGSVFGYFSDTFYDGDQKVAKRYFIKTSAKKMIEFTSDAVYQVNAVMSAIKERYKCMNVGFFIADSSGIDSFLNYHYEEFCNYNRYKTSLKKDTMKKDISSQVKRNDVAVLDDVVGRDKMFYIPSSKMKIKENDLTINPDANVKKIAKDFTKHMIKKKISRVLLNEFIKIIA